MYFQLTGVLQTSGFNAVVPFEQPQSLPRACDLHIDGYMVTDKSEAVNISGATIQLVITGNSGAIVLQKNASITTGASGTWHLDLANTETDLIPGSYYFQVNYTAPNGYRDYVIPTSELRIH